MHRDPFFTMLRQRPSLSASGGLLLLRRGHDGADLGSGRRLASSQGQLKSAAARHGSAHVCGADNACCQQLAAWPCRRPRLWLRLHSPAMTSRQPDRARARPGRCAGRRAGPTRTVARVIDGETVALDDGTELRLIGALAPAGDRCRRRARHVAAGDRGAARNCAPSSWANRSSWPSAASAPTAMAACRRSSSGWRRARRWVQGHLLRARPCARLRAGRQSRLRRRRLLEPRARGARGASRPVGGRRLSDRGRRIRLASCRATGARFRWSKVGSRASRRCAARSHLNFGADRRRAFAVSLRRGDRGAPRRPCRRSEGARGQRSRVSGAGSSSASGPTDRSIEPRA